MPEPTSQLMQNALDADIDAKMGEDFIEEFAPQIEKAIDDRGAWAENAATYYLYQMGQIGKPNPDQPFVGSADLRPLRSLGYIRRILPNFVSSVWDAPHVARYVGGGTADSRQEQFVDFVFKSEMPDFWDTLNAAAWRLLGPAGTCVLKVSYDYKTQAQTKVEPVTDELRESVKAASAQAKTLNTTPEKLKLTLIAAHFKWDLDDEVGKKRAKSVLKQLDDDTTEVITAIVDKPCGSPIKVQCLDNHTDFITPWDPRGFQDSPWVAEWQIYDHRQLKEEQACGKFKNVDEIIEDTQLWKDGDQKSPSGKGASRGEEGERFQTFRNLVQGLLADTSLARHVPVFEIHCWRPRSWIARFNGLVEDDETEVRCVVNYCPTARKERAILRAMEHPYDFDGLYNWPYVQIKYNDSRDGIYCGMGVEALTNALNQEEIIHKNAAIDRVTLATCYDEYFNSRAFSGNPPINKPRMAGQRHSVMGDPSQAVYIPQRPNFSDAHDIKAQQMTQDGKELVGVADLSGMPAYQEPPTKGEIEYRTAPSINIQGHEVKNWLNGFSQIFRMVHMLNKQYRFADAGTDVFQFTNEQGAAAAYITQADFAPRFIIRAGGDVGRMDQEAEARKLIAWKQLYADNPAYAPIVNAKEVYDIGTNMLIGPIAAQKVTNPPQQIEQFQQQFMEMKAKELAAMETTKQKGGSKKPKQMPGVNMGSIMMKPGQRQ